MSNIKCSVDHGVLVIGFTIDTLANIEVVESTGVQLLAMTCQAPNDTILLDFEGVKFLDSSMVGKLFLLSKRCRFEQIRLRMRNLNPVIREVFEIVGLTQLIQIIVDSDDDTLDALNEEHSSDSNSDTAEIVDVGDLKRKADTGDVHAMVEYAHCLENGDGGEQDLEEAFRWYRKAADAGNADAQYKTGMATAYGIGVESNWNEAMRWYRLAAEQGNAEAEYAVGMIHRYGLAGEPIRTEAIEWYKKSLAHGYDKARIELDDLGVAVD